MKMVRKIGYGAGDLGISISYFTVGFFFMYYLTDIVKMRPEMAGLAIFIGKLWDGINDPLIGIFNDRIKSKVGPKRAFILWGIIPFAASFFLLWLIPGGINESMQFILAVASTLLYATAYSIVVVPYMAMVPVMSDDYDERTQITGIRAILSTFGTILGGGAAILVSSFTNEAFGLRAVMLVFAAFTGLSLFVASLSIKGVEKRQVSEKRIMKVSLKQYLGLIKERNVFILLMFKFLGAVGTGTLTASFPYFTEHILGNKGLSSMGLGVYILVSAAFIPIWNRLTHYFDKRRLLLFANVSAAVILLIIALSISSDSKIGFFIGCGFLGSTMAAFLFMPYSLVPDLVEYYEYVKGEHHESIFFGLWMAFHQLGLAISGIILGYFLGFFGYSGRFDVLPDSALVGIRLAFGLIPAVFLILAAVVLQMYGIDRKFYVRIREKLGKI